MPGTRPDFDPAKMDAAADVAAKGLSTLKTAKDVAEWWGAHLMNCGHKRLGRKLIAHFAIKSTRSEKAAK
jgi:hypothetical protein